jgi:hypothetical protein
MNRWPRPGIDSNRRMTDAERLFDAAGATCRTRGGRPARETVPAAAELFEQLARLRLMHRSRERGGGGGRIGTERARSNPPFAAPAASPTGAGGDCRSADPAEVDEIRHLLQVMRNKPIGRSGGLLSKIVN